VQHMPPWDSVLPQEGVWAIKTFIEARIDEVARAKAAKAAEEASAKR